MRRSRFGSFALAGLLLAALAAIGPSVATAASGTVTGSGAAPAARALDSRVALLAVQQARLTASDGGSGYYVGYSVAISGDTALVGEEYQGQAYVFTFSNGAWTQQARLTSAGSGSNNWFGSTVAIDGDTAVVGAPWDNVGSNFRQGSAYVFTRSGGSWSQQATLTASDGAADGQFGGAVAVSGDTVMVGGGGHAYVFTRSAGIWGQQAKLTNSDGIAMGHSVSLSGDTAVAGAPPWSDGDGAAYVYTRSGTSWSQQARLTASDPTPGEAFGRSVAVSGDTVLVGAPNTRGTAYVFTRSGATWGQQQEIVPDDITPYSWFGQSVALVGDTALIGSPWDQGNGVPANSHGAAYVYNRTAGVWSKTSKMTTTAFNSRFGYSVALANGTALLGAPYDDVGSPVASVDQGSAYIFRLGTDSTPPTTTLSADPAANTAGWNDSPVTVTLGANDGPLGWGVASTHYRVGTGTDTTYSAPFAISAEGTTTIHYWSVDNAGNPETAKTSTVRIDSGPPTSTCNAVARYATSGTVSLSASDPRSGIAWKRYAVSGAQSLAGTYTAPLTFSVPGTYTLSFSACDRAGNVEATRSATFWVRGPLSASELAGPARMDTAVAIVKRSFQATSDVVICATAYNFPDALGAGALAGAYDCPILLVPKTGTIPATVTAEIRALNAKKIIVIGSTAAVDVGVWNQLKSIVGTSGMQRVFGPDRYATGIAVATETVRVMASRGEPFAGKAFAVTGQDFPDALLASPIAYRDGRLILLVHPAIGVTTALRSAITTTGVNDIALVAKTTTLSDTVRGQLASAIGKTFSAVPRIGATSDRYQMSLDVATWAAGNCGFCWNNCALATGQNFPDALAAGPLQGRRAAPILLTPTAALDTRVRASLVAHKYEIARLSYLGSKAAVSQAVRTSAQSALW